MIPRSLPSAIPQYSYSHPPSINRFASLNRTESCDLSHPASLPLNARAMGSRSAKSINPKKSPPCWNQFKLKYYTTYVEWPLEGSAITDPKLSKILSEYLGTLDTQSAPLLPSDTCKEILIAALALSNPGPVYTCIGLKLYENLNEKDLKTTLESAIDADCDFFLKTVLDFIHSDKQNNPILLESLLHYALQRFRPQGLSILLGFKNSIVIHTPLFQAQPLKTSFLLNSLLHYRSQTPSKPQSEDFIACIEAVLHFHLARTDEISSDISLFIDLFKNPILHKHNKRSLLALMLDMGLLTQSDCENDFSLNGIFQALEHGRKKIASTKRAQS